MPFLRLISLFLLSLCALPGHGAIHLDRSELFIGDLPQEAWRPVDASLVILRSSQTPKKVKLSFRHKYEATVCAETGWREVWVPGREECDLGCPGYYHPGHWCRWVPGYWTTESYCVRYKDVLLDKSRTINLNFRRANKLKRGQRESFEIFINQVGMRSTSLKLDGRALNTLTPYEVKKIPRILTRQGLKFKAK